MPTARPRVYVTFHDATYAALKRFAEEKELSLSELVAAICFPTARAIAWELAHREEDQPSLFPDALVDLYRSEPLFDQEEAQEDLQRVLGALRQMTLAAHALGYPEGSQDGGTEDGATAPPGGDAAVAEPSSTPAPATPVRNTGVTIAPAKGNQRVIRLVTGGRKS